MAGVNTFLKYYQKFWPAGVNCLVLADADAAGRSWWDGDNCFATKLTTLCRKVVVVQCAPYKDFNDLYRVEKVGPEQIAELLASKGMAVESGVLA